MAPPTSSEQAAARAADRARIADLDARMMELEASLTALKEEKKLVQDRLAAYAYPVLTLPNEITSEVFIHCLPVYPKCPAPIGILSPHLLCQICRKWRDIALTTPALWRAVSLTLRAPDRLEQAVCLLESSLARSGSRLLSIELKDNSTVDMSQFCRIIADYRARCEHLALSINKPFALLPTSHPSLPFLRTLKLGWPGHVTPTVLAAPSAKSRHKWVSQFLSFHFPVVPDNCTIRARYHDKRMCESPAPVGQHCLLLSQCQRRRGHRLECNPHTSGNTHLAQSSETRKGVFLGDLNPSGSTTSASY
ncbi:hypothetical protein DFH06DRAFT_152013 [Mycena polygramma]|nr:hypothetical protein DFH06DRAFT_152013 [Mycena polygramma]